MSEPVKHHFIPQFILRNFINDKGQINYWNKKNSQLSKRNPKSVFMVENLYRDEFNHPTDPAIIEKKFAKLESEIAVLFQEKIINKNPIILTRAENEKLRKFLYLLSFRSSTKKQQYIDGNFDELTKLSLKDYVVNDDYVDLWLREIETILDLEEYNDIHKNQNVSWTIRTDFHSHLIGYYMTFVTPRGQEFLISDVFPTAEIFPLKEGVNLYPHYMFPISPDLMLLLNMTTIKPGNEVLPITQAMMSLSKIHGNLIKPPKAQYKILGHYSKEDKFIYNVGKVYSNDVVYLNALALNEVRTGFSFRSDNITESINYYQTNPSTFKYNKNDFSDLLNRLEKKVKI